MSLILFQTWKRKNISTEHSIYIFYVPQKKVSHTGLERHEGE